MKRLALLLALVLVTGLSNAQTISFPDTVRLEACSGSITYDYSVNCDGDKEARAIFVWRNAQDSIVQSGTRAQGANQFRATDTASVYLTVYGADTLQSNLCTLIPLCLNALNIEELVLRNDPRIEIYNTLGQEMSEPWADLPAGLYIITFNHRAVKILK